jgi:hypothetical protein
MSKPVKCLMIQTKDQRQFFTKEENYPELIEFSKTFDAELSIVKAKEEVEVIDLMNLPTAICDCNYKIKKPEVEIIEVKAPTNKRRKNRSKILKTAKKIREHIREKLESGEPVKLAQIASKFKKYNLTLACFCQHVRAVRQQMEREGFTIEKIGAGQYVLK